MTDVEVLQEILHRFVAIDRLASIQPAFDVRLAVVDETLPRWCWVFGAPG